MSRSRGNCSTDENKLSKTKTKKARTKDVQDGDVSLHCSDTCEWKETLSSMTDELECPVCMGCIVPPIKTCSSGHGICANCSSQIDICPLCNLPWTLNKNTLLNKLVSKMILPCTFREAGCPEMVAFETRKDHENECAFRIFDCPALTYRIAPGCNWRGNQSEVSDHLMIFHRENCSVFNYDEKAAYVASKPFKGIKLIVIDDQALVFHRQGSEVSTQYFVLQCLGNTETAEKFRYRLIHTREDGFSLTFEGVTIPYSVNIDDCFKSRKCFSIQLDSYKQFVPDMKVRRYELQILRNEILLS